MLTQARDWLKTHTPPTTLVVGVLAWIFGKKISGQELQNVGEVVTLVLGGSALPAASSAASSATTTVASKIKAKLPGKPKAAAPAKAKAR